MTTSNASNTVSSALRQAAQTSNLKKRAKSSEYGVKAQNSLLDLLRVAEPSFLGFQDDRKQRASARRASEKKKNLDEDFLFAEANQGSSTASSVRSASTDGLPKSKPIRIPADSSSPRTYAMEHSSATEAELEHFYNESTWRMFLLIQSARIAENNHHNTPYHGRVPPCLHCPSTQSLGHRPSSAGCPTQSMPGFDGEDEGIFDFEP